MPKISEATVSRLPIYADCLARFAGHGVDVISSEELATAAGVTAAQLRKDLSCLGSFGTRGIGYVVDDLRDQIGRHLGLTRQWSVAIVGYGKLGTALANYRGFGEKSFKVVAAFDVDSGTVGTKSNGLEVFSIEDIDQVVREKGIQLAIITTPASAAQPMVDRLILAGVKSILSFAPTVLNVPDGVVLRAVDLSTEMQILSFYETLRRNREEHAAREQHETPIAQS
jgi:redox-sensing transcriptional repressor